MRLQSCAEMAPPFILTWRFPTWTQSWVALPRSKQWTDPWTSRFHPAHSPAQRWSWPRGEFRVWAHRASEATTRWVVLNIVSSCTGVEALNWNSREILCVTIVWVSDELISALCTHFVWMNHSLLCVSLMSALIGRHGLARFEVFYWYVYRCMCG